MQLPQTIVLATLFVLATSMLTHGMRQSQDNIGSGSPQTNIVQDSFEKSMQDSQSSVHIDQQQQSSSFLQTSSDLTGQPLDSIEKKKSAWQKLKGLNPFKGIRNYRKRTVSRFANWLSSKFGEGPELVKQGLVVPQKEDCDVVTHAAKEAKARAAEAFKKVCIAIQDQLKAKTDITAQALAEEIKTALELYKAARDLNKKRKTTPSSIWDAALIRLRMVKLVAYGKIVPSLPKMARTVGVYQSVAKKYEWLKTHAKEASSAIGRRITSLVNRFRKDGGKDNLIKEFKHLEVDVNGMEKELNEEMWNQFTTSQICLKTAHNNSDNHNNGEK